MKPLIAFDTSGPWVAAALVLPTGTTVRSEQMQRGQAERLIVLLDEMLAEAEIGWPDIGRIGVGVGPGNFTGVRVSVSAARGLALGLGVPAIGIDGLAALGEIGLEQALPAPKGQSYRPAPDGAPEMVAQPAPDIDPKALVTGIAQLAATADLPAPRPAPLYLRPADAAPPSDPPPVILPA